MNDAGGTVVSVDQTTDDPACTDIDVIESTFVIDKTDTDGPVMLMRRDPRAVRQAEVNLHIYDVRGNVAVEYMNTMFRMLGTGAFHVAVEVYGDEWSYGFLDESPGCTGVFNCEPGQNKEYGHHREMIAMGKTQKTWIEVDNILETLCAEWHGEDYDLLRHNCCHFSDAFCRRLDVGGIPAWVMNLASVGGSLTDGIWKIVETPRDLLFHKAKAGGSSSAVSSSASRGENGENGDTGAGENSGKLSAGSSGKDFLRHLTLSLPDEEPQLAKSAGRLRGVPRKEDSETEKSGRSKEGGSSMEANAGDRPKRSNGCCCFRSSRSKSSS